jgi:biopolymer transport protein TolR
MSMSMGGGGVKAEPNVTPMIDVMLVLLIIFMIVIPQLNAGFVAIPPQAQNLKPHPEEEQDQVLGIDKDGQYYLNKKPLPNADLGDRLKEIYDKRQEDKIMYLKAHKDLKYSKILDAIDVAAHSGVRVAGMISDPIPGSKSMVEGDNVLTEGMKKGGKP